MSCLQSCNASASLCAVRMAASTFRISTASDSVSSGRGGPPCWLHATSYAASLDEAIARVARGRGARTDDRLATANQEKPRENNSFRPKIVPEVVQAPESPFDANGDRRRLACTHRDLGSVSSIDKRHRSGAHLAIGADGSHSLWAWIYLRCVEQECCSAIRRRIASRNGKFLIRRDRRVDIDITSKQNTHNVGSNPVAEVSIA